VKHQQPASIGPVARRSGKPLLRIISALSCAGAAFLAGCGAGGPVTASTSNAAFSVSPGSAHIDTSCTGCNALNAHAAPVHQFSATSADGAAASVTWSLSGGDPVAGPGKINDRGQYSPPSYLSADRAQVQVTATSKSQPSLRATSLLTLTPAFLQPLTPENAALGPNSSVTLTGYLAETGGASEIRFALANSPSGDSGGEGTLGTTTCQRTSHTFTSCSVTYSAPSAVSAAAVTYVVATLPGSSAKIATALLLNAPGVSSNPAAHQASQSGPMLLGSSGGNNNDFDEKGGNIVDCCSGTLGALVQDETGRQYLLSNNHVLARSDQASVGDTIVQPGLIDNNCTPNGNGPGTVPVAALTAWPPLRSLQTNVDAAIAQVASHTVDSAGNIFGITNFGGAHDEGAVFELSRAGTKYSYSVIYSFCSQNSCTDGIRPVGGLALDGAGNLYGTTTRSGDHDEGTLFKLSPNGSGYSFRVLYQFCREASCTDGGDPEAALKFDGAGDLLGTAVQGGAAGAGVIFEFTFKDETERVLHSFCALESCTDGGVPTSTLTIDTAGDLFGTTVAGGSTGSGVAFELRPTRK